MICSSPYMVRIIKSRGVLRAGYAARMGQKRNGRMMGKPEKWEPLGRSRRRWIVSIKIGLPGIEGSGLDWVVLFEDSDSWRVLLIVVMSLPGP